MNKRFRMRVESYIADAIRIYNEAKDENHNGLKGLVREIAVELLFRPLLPQIVDIGTGKIIDSYGNESKQVDIILYNKNLLPPAMYGNRFGLYPIESCLYALEVKSAASVGEAKSACELARSISDLKPRPGFFAQPRVDNQSVKLTHIPESYGQYPNFGYFAFSTDLKKNSNELDRFLNNQKYHHSIHFVALCVVGTITSSYSRRDEKWKHISHNEKYDEVVYFLSTILNTVSKKLATQTMFNIGPYLWDPDQV